MKLTILGCMGGYPANNQGTSAYLIEAHGFNLLLDVGSGSYQNLEKIMEPTDIDAVLLTHYHHDHIADLGVLQYAFQLKPIIEDLPKKELTIYGHNLSEEFERLTLPNVSKGIAYQADETLRIGPFKITFLKTIHPVPCFAVKIVDKFTKKSMVFTADSGYLADFITFAEGVDLLLADTNFFEGKENHLVHMTAPEVGKIANLAQVKQVILTHLPAKGDLIELKKQAQQLAEDIPIFVAKIFDTYNI